MPEPIRVAIRGIGGHLGHRLALAIYRHSGLGLSVGITDADEASLDRLDQLPEPVAAGLAGKLYLDAPPPRVKQVNARRRHCYAHVGELRLAEQCDVVIDTVIPLDLQGTNWYPLGFPRPVLMQSGAFPQGRLIAPPLVQPTSHATTTYWRLGDCILGGLSPVLFALREWIAYLRVDVLMQYGQRLADYPTNDWIHSVFTADRSRSILDEELALLGNPVNRDQTGVFVGSFYQVPGLEYYVITLTCYPLPDTSQATQLIEERLRASPRVWFAGSNITNTHQIDQVRRQREAVGFATPPVIIFDRIRSPYSGSSSSLYQFTVSVALHWRYAAVLPTLDAIQIVAGGIDPLEAMRRTDAAFGIGSTPRALPG